MSQPIQPPQPYFPYYQPPRKTRWWIPLIIVGVILLLLFIMGSIFIGMLSAPFQKEIVELKPNSVLYLTFEGGAQEQPAQSPFSFLSSSRPATLFETLTAIKRAKDDEMIEGIYIKPQMITPGWAKSDEIREALIDFKESGKFIYAHLQIGNEASYYQALPADSIFMPYEGIVELNGFGITSLFMKNMFEKLGITFYVSHFEDFKSAGESLERSNFSDSSRLQLRLLLDARNSSFISAVAFSRDLEEEEVKAALARGVYTADSLMENGFVDALLSESDLRELMRKKIYSTNDLKDEQKLRLVSPHTYLNAPQKDISKDYDKNSQIAIIYGSGAINHGKRNDNPFSDETAVHSGDFVKYLKSARENDKIKAIILRIDSPGGSVFGSDEIYQEILKTREVKPVIASMSDYCASGGYYIAVACDTIITHPLTITGSIGVVSVIPNVSSMMNKLYITADTIGTSPSAFFLNGIYPLTEKDKKQFTDMSRSIYFRFIDKVAKARGKSFDEARALAKGRVWMGEQALKNGLADIEGGLLKAVSVAKARIGIADDVKVRVVQYPKQEDDIKAFLKLFGISDEDEASIGFKNAVAQALGLAPAAFDQVVKSLPEGSRRQIEHILQLLGMARKETVLMAMPEMIDAR